MLKKHIEEGDDLDLGIRHEERLFVRTFLWSWFSAVPELHGAFKVHNHCTQPEAGVFLNISARFT